MDVQQGNIVFSGKRVSNWFSNGVKSITNSKWSHSFFLLGEVMGQMAAIEAELDISVVPWQREYVDKNEDYYEVYRLLKASPEDQDRAAKYCYYNYAEEAYGFFAIPWFVYRIYMKKWFGIKVTNNWSKSGMFCSGLTYNYLDQVGNEYKDVLNDFDQYSLCPQDLYDIILKRPDLFEFVGKRE